MANTIKLNGKILTIVPDGSTDFAWTEIVGSIDNGLFVNSILFLPSGANDRLIMLDTDDSDADAVIVDLGLSGTGALSKDFFGEQMKLYLDADHAGVNFGTAANCRIIIDLA